MIMPLPLDKLYSPNLSNWIEINQPTKNVEKSCLKLDFFYLNAHVNCWYGIFQTKTMHYVSF